ncbi:MAG: hypothetical protein M3376_13315 [Actinomycetota bacterium]|nr:hypothetical protein [Actinomycetota bacterium]
MHHGARTPEELETLFEDAFVVRDRDVLADLFEDGALLIPAFGLPEARGRREITKTAAGMWDDNRTYLADPAQVLQSRDTALVVTGRGINVMRRGSDGAWRYAIAVLADDDTKTNEEKP